MEPLSNDPLSGILVVMIFLTILMKIKTTPDKGAELQAKADEREEQRSQNG